MTRFLKSLFFSKILAVVIISNVLVMSLCNLLELEIIFTVFIYLVIFLIILPALLSGKNKRTPMKITSNMIIWIFAMWVSLVLLRLPYSLEWLPNNQAFAQFDDIPRLADLIGMTLSDKYPCKNPLNQNYLLSYYYAALIPLAVLKLAIPLLTLKDVLFLGNALYHILILFSILEVSNLILPSRRSIWTMIYLCTVFGGLDWVADIVLKGNDLFAHHEWWQNATPLHGNAQISSFFTGLMWAFSHFTAAYSCVLAFVFLNYFIFQYRYVKPLSIGLLLISGFHSSIFGLLPLSLIGIVEHRYIRRILTNFKILLPLIIIFASPLFLYTHRIIFTGMQFASFRIYITDMPFLDKALSFPIWFLLTSTVEFSLIPVVLFFLYARFTYKEKMYFIASHLFFISTYFFAFAQGNNYSMRGMFIPSFVFFFLFAKYAPALPIVEKMVQGSSAVVLTIFMLFPLALGTFLEIGWCAKMSYGSMSMVRSMFRNTLPEQIILNDYRAIARDSSLKYYEQSKHDCWNNNPEMPHFRCAYFNAEKFMNVSVDNMDYWEKEFLRLPKANRFW